MEIKEILQLITKLEDEFDSKEGKRLNPYTEEGLALITDKYHYVNYGLRDIITNKEELRKAYFQVYLKLYSIYLKRLIKRNEGGLLYEIISLCWAIDYKDDFCIDYCCSRNSILWVLKDNNDGYFSKYHYGYGYGYNIFAQPSEYSDEVLKEAVRIIYGIAGEQFDKRVYKGKALLEQPVEEGWHKLVMYCLDYFQEGQIKDELYLECALA